MIFVVVGIFAFIEPGQHVRRAGRRDRLLLPLQGDLRHRRRDRDEGRVRPLVAAARRRARSRSASRSGCPGASATRRSCCSSTSASSRCRRGSRTSCSRSSSALGRAASHRRDRAERAGRPGSLFARRFSTAPGYRLRMQRSVYRIGRCVDRSRARSRSSRSSDSRPPAAAARRRRRRHRRRSRGRRTRPRPRRRTPPRPRRPRPRRPRRRPRRRRPEAGGGEGDAAPARRSSSTNCGGCHTLADAGTTGTVGPNLDDAQPSFELVVDRVTNGQGAMPPFEGTLTEQQIADVSAYVSQSPAARAGCPARFLDSLRDRPQGRPRDPDASRAALARKGCGRRTSTRSSPPTSAGARSCRRSTSSARGRSSRASRRPEELEALQRVKAELKHGRGRARRRRGGARRGARARPESSARVGAGRRHGGGRRRAPRRRRAARARRASRAHGDRPLRHGARRARLRRAVRLHHRRLRARRDGSLPVRARAPGRGRLHAGAPARARARGGDVRDRVLPDGRSNIYALEADALFLDGHLGGRARVPAHGRDARGAAGPLHGLLDQLQARGGRRRARTRAGCSACTSSTRSRCSSSSSPRPRGTSTTVMLELEEQFVQALGCRTAW